MSAFEREAEVLKLARTLGVPAAKLEFMHRLPPAAIRKLRRQASASLFDAHKKLFQRVASASKLLPVPLMALIAEKAFGPLLCARTTGLLAPERAVEVAKRLPIRFLADLCLELDPSSADDVLVAMPVERVVEVSRELARRKEYITMGRFVDILGDEAIRATMADLKDDEALLRIGFFVEDEERLSQVIGLLPRARLHNIVRLAAGVDQGGDAALWPEALALMNRIDEPQRRQMATLAAELDDAAVTRMVESTQSRELWPAMLPVVSLMGAASQRRLINLPAVQDANVLGAIIRAADAAGLWPQLLPLVALMDNAGQARALRVAQAQGEAVVARLAESLRALARPRPVSA